MTPNSPAATASGIRRRDLFAAASALPLLASAAPPVQPRRLVVVVCSGGWDTAYSIDPKLGQVGFDTPTRVNQDDPLDVEQVETFSGIPVAFNVGRRPSVSGFFERWGSRTCVANGVWVGGVSHMTNIRKILTGTTVEGRPDFGTIASSVIAPDHAIGHVDLVGISLPGELPSRLVRVGHNGQLRTLLGNDLAFAPPGFRPDDVQSLAVSDFRSSRLERLRALRGGSEAADATLDTLADAAMRRPGLEAMAESLDYALAFGAGPESFDFQLELVADLFRRDLCRVVTMASTVSWDSHVGNNAAQSDNLEELFDGLTRLCTDFEEAGILETTTIAVVSEMTRTPLLNATSGKDHWPGASAILVGCGVGGGRVVGSTNGAAEPEPLDGAIQEYSNLVAGILSVMGVDSESWLPGIAPMELG
ncbi:MAG: DUF1501 domain-containing protein [Deltaproteobacteria bacterium]|nr:DUF1501 domain-containing protein [Deltaproteobacteria bacterium]